MSKTPITSGVVARRYQVQRRRWYDAFTAVFRCARDATAGVEQPLILANGSGLTLRLSG